MQGKDYEIIPLVGENLCHGMFDHTVVTAVVH